MRKVTSALRQHFAPDCKVQLVDGGRMTWEEYRGRIEAIGGVVTAVRSASSPRITCTVLVAPDGEATILSCVEHVENRPFSPVAYRWPPRCASAQELQAALARPLSLLAQHGVVGHTRLGLELNDTAQHPLRIASLRLGMGPLHATCCAAASLVGLDPADFHRAAAPPAVHCVFSTATVDTSFSFVRYTLLQRCLEVRHFAWSTAEQSGMFLLPTHPSFRENCVCASVASSALAADAALVDGLSQLQTDVGSADPAMSSLGTVIAAVQSRGPGLSP